MKVHDSIKTDANVIHQYTLEEPTICPMCQHAIKPYELSKHFYKAGPFGGRLVYVYKCTACESVFLAFHSCILMSSSPSFGDVKLQYLAPVKFKERSFENRICDISPNFVKVYNQAFQAETEGLDEIAGMGLRKALEFLIKDYLIFIKPDDTETIKRMELGNCIANKVANDNIKVLASRCAWIGNDFTHYIRRFEEYDISMLHTLIEATVYWINIELITNEARQIQPQSRA